jgi:hypothetical protein
VTQVGVRYRTGHSGVRVIFGDGVEVFIPARRTIRFTQAPKAIIGRLYRVGDDGMPIIEAPEFRTA